MWITEKSWNTLMCYINCDNCGTSTSTICMHILHIKVFIRLFTENINTPWKKNQRKFSIFIPLKVNGKQAIRLLNIIKNNIQCNEKNFSVSHSHY